MNEQTRNPMVSRACPIRLSSLGEASDSESAVSTIGAIFTVVLYFLRLEITEAV